METFYFYPYDAGSDWIPGSWPYIRGSIVITVDYWHNYMCFIVIIITYTLSTSLWGGTTISNVWYPFSVDVGKIHAVQFRTLPPFSAHCRTEGQQSAVSFRLDRWSLLYKPSLYRMMREKATTWHNGQLSHIQVELQHCSENPNRKQTWNNWTERSTSLAMMEMKE